MNKKNLRKTKIKMESDQGHGKRKTGNRRKEIGKANFVFRALALLTCKSHKHQIVLEMLLRYIICIFYLRP